MTLTSARGLASGANLDIRKGIESLVPSRGYESLKLKASLFIEIRGIMEAFNLIDANDAQLQQRQEAAQLAIESFLIKISTDIIRSNPQR